MNKAGVLAILIILTSSIIAIGQNSAQDSVQMHAKGNRLSVGAYGEITYSRNFYSDSPFRYYSAAAHANEPSHGRFDIPHAVLYLNYDFGNGWTFNTEIEFEHGGSGSSVEREGEEGGEWEVETERGGEVELEQLWIQKSWSRAINLRAGHLVVPFGLTNAHHEPLNFFTVYRNEGENTILPCTWHQTGVSLWGRTQHWRYEFMLNGGLDSYMFDRLNWIGNGTTSPYEFDVANKFGILSRLDNYSVKGLRLGVSAYYGKSMHNTYPHDMEGTDSKYKDLQGNVCLGAIDFTYKRHDFIIRGNADYGYVSDAMAISSLKANQASGDSPYKKSGFGSNAIACGIELGYDLLSLVPKYRDNRQLYIFGHYEFYDSYIGSLNKYTQRQVIACGLNYRPMPQICFKLDYCLRMFSPQFNNEPSINIGICYQGIFM